MIEIFDKTHLKRQIKTYYLNFNKMCINESIKLILRINNKITSYLKKKSTQNFQL